MATKARLSDAQLEALRRIDSPTIANAIETFGVRPHVSGFMGREIRCLSPELGVMVGYAVTATCDSQTEDAPHDPRPWWEVLKAIDASPKPAVLVFQDVGPRPSHSCHFGDGMATISRRLGAIGLVTDGGVRDLAGCRALGFQYYAPGVTVSHGNHRIVAAGSPVEVSGVRVEPGDLIHADENGVVLIPAEIAGEVAGAARAVLEEEAELIGFYRGEHFSLGAVARRLGVREP
jgi:regulator of RNase E activity RraA